MVDVMFSLGSEERDLLEESYPEADLENVLVVNMVPLGHEEPPARFWLIIAALGIIPLLIGLGAIAFGVLRARRGRGA